MTLTLTPRIAIVTARFGGGLLAIIAAAGALAPHARWISRLVSFAVGALLGAMLLELVPHPLEHGAGIAITARAHAALEP